MSKFYTILVGAQNMRNIDCINQFNSEKSALDFAESANIDFINDYDSKQAWLNDSNALEWVLFSEDEAIKEHPDLVASLNQ